MINAKRTRMRRHFCECCNHSATSGTTLKKHFTSFKHEQNIIAAECARLGMGYEMESNRVGRPHLPVEQRFLIKKMKNRDSFYIQWNEDGESYMEHFSYCRRPEKNAMDEAIMRQAELRA